MFAMVFFSVTFSKDSEVYVEDILCLPTESRSLIEKKKDCVFLRLIDVRQLSLYMYLYLSIYDFLGKIKGGLKIWSVILASTYLYKYIYFLGLFWKFWKF